MIAGFTEDHTVAVCRTTTSDGGDWSWVMIQVNGLHMRLSQVAADGTRRAPPGVDDQRSNWVCTPPGGAQQWRPAAAELANVTVEANLILAQYRANPGAWMINQPGVSGDLQPLGVHQPGPIGPGGAGGGGAVATGSPGGAALGVGAGSPSQSAGQLRAMTLSPNHSNRSRDKDKKKKKKRKKKHKKKRSGSSSSSTSSSRSRSGGSSSVSSGEKKKPLRWKIDAKDKKVPLSSLTHVAQLKLKKRGDLVSFAARHPGALTAEQFSGLTEVRDMKEVVTSAEILDAVNREEISQALDVLCQRILAIQAAKQKGGTWEKAEAIELVDNRKSLASTSMLALTNQ